MELFRDDACAILTTPCSGNSDPNESESGRRWFIISHSCRHLFRRLHHITCPDREICRLIENYDFGHGACTDGTTLPDKLASAELRS